MFSWVIFMQLYHWVWQEFGNVVSVRVWLEWLKCWTIDSELLKVTEQHFPTFLWCCYLHYWNSILLYERETKSFWAATNVIKFVSVLVWRLWKRLFTSGPSQKFATLITWSVIFYTEYEYILRRTIPKFRIFGN